MKPGTKKVLPKNLKSLMGEVEQLTAVPKLDQSKWSLADEFWEQVSKDWDKTPAGKVLAVTFKEARVAASVKTSITSRNSNLKVLIRNQNTVCVVKPK